MKLTPSSCLSIEEEEEEEEEKEEKKESEEKKEEEEKVVLYHLSAITSHFGTMEAVCSFSLFLFSNVLLSPS